MAAEKVLRTVTHQVRISRQRWVTSACQESGNETVDYAMKFHQNFPILNDR